MPPEDIKDGETPPQDEIKNLKAEFSRKMGNIEQTNKQLAESQAALLAQLQQMAPKPAPKETESLSDLMYRDPEAYARKVADEADRRADARIREAQQSQQKQNSVIQAVVSEYPELQNGDHDLTTLAVSKFNALSDAEKTSPVAYKAAVAEAAAELGIKPKSKRKETDDDYVGSGSSGSSSRQRGARKAELDPRTEEFARLVGLDTSKKEVRERLTNNHGRDTYLKWK